jgi:pilus assembly protein CpaB
VQVREWPRELVPDSAIKSIDQASGRIVLSPLIPGEILLDGKLATEGVTRGAGNLVRRGMRAYSILASTAASSVAGLILPGDHVDVILSMQSQSGDESGGGTSTTLLQNVEILAVDQKLDVPMENKPSAKLTTVTLLVTQRQAALLGLGQKAGILSLSLRNPEDEEMADTEPVTLAEIRYREELPIVLHGKDTSAPQAPAEVTTAQAEVPASETPPPADVQAQTAAVKRHTSAIRTLRGNQVGVVSIELGDN